VGRLLRVLRWAEPAAVALLAALCVVGAFLGPVRARAMFNSPPMAALWLLALLWAVARAVPVRRAVSRAALRAALVGVALIRAGGILGSEAGHRLAGRLLGRDKAAGGYMFLPKGRFCDDLFDRDFEHRIGRLPFQLVLRDLQVAGDRARGAVREYAGHVEVVEDERQVAEGVIEVNRPLRYGGYHFYQYSGDSEGQGFTVLMVKSARGLMAVYGGMALLCGGVFWLCWLPTPAARGEADGD